MSGVLAALIQLDIRTGQREANLARATKWVAEAAGDGAEFVVLPELWATGYALDRASEVADELGAGAFAAMRDLAGRHRVWLAGSLLETFRGRVHNTLAIYDTGGQLRAFYRKTHLFGLMEERDHLEAGSSAVIADLPSGLTGLAVCYDLRFPNLFAAYADARCETLLVCAEWPNPRMDHWRTLIRARAIESQAYVLAANRVGGSGTTFFGHSMIVDPWGEIVVEGNEAEGVVIGRIDRERVAEVRTRYPFLADRRTFEAAVRTDEMLVQRPGEQ